MNSISDVSAPARNDRFGVIHPVGSGAPVEQVGEARRSRPSRGSTSRWRPPRGRRSAPDCSAATADATHAPKGPRPHGFADDELGSPDANAGASGECSLPRVRSVSISPSRSLQSSASGPRCGDSPCHTGMRCGPKSNVGSRRPRVATGFPTRALPVRATPVPFGPRAPRRGSRLPLGYGRGPRPTAATRSHARRARTATSRIKLGTAVVQLRGRAPATLGMQA